MIRRRSSVARNAWTNKFAEVDFEKKAREHLLYTNVRNARTFIRLGGLVVYPLVGPLTPLLWFPLTRTSALPKFPSTRSIGATKSWLLAGAAAGGGGGAGGAGDAGDAGAAGGDGTAALAGFFLAFALCYAYVALATVAVACDWSDWAVRVPPLAAVARLQKAVQGDERWYYPLAMSAFLVVTGSLDALNAGRLGCGREYSVPVTLFLVMATRIALSPPFLYSAAHLAATYAVWFACDAAYTDGVQVFWAVFLAAAFVYVGVAAYRQDSLTRDLFEERFNTDRRNANLARKNLEMYEALQLTEEQKGAVESMLEDMRVRMEMLPQPHHIPFDHLVVRKKIGSGTFGDVWLALHTRDNANVAVKKLKAEKVEQHMLKRFRDEIILMSRIEHPRIVRFVGMCWEDPNLCLVLEFVSGGSLEEMLAHDRSDSVLLSSGGLRQAPKLGWRATKLPVARGIAAAVGYLHSLDPKHVSPPMSQIPHARAQIIPPSSLFASAQRLTSVPPRCNHKGDPPRRQSRERPAHRALRDQAGRLRRGPRDPQPEGDADHVRHAVLPGAGAHPRRARQREVRRVLARRRDARDGVRERRARAGVPQQERHGDHDRRGPRVAAAFAAGLQGQVPGAREADPRVPREQASQAPREQGRGQEARKDRDQVETGVVHVFVHRIPRGRHLGRAAVRILGAHGPAAQALQAGLARFSPARDR